MENQLIKLSPSSILDVVYAVQRLERSLKKLDAEHKAITSSLETGSASSNDSKPPAEIMLLSASSGRLIADCLDVPEIEQEIERAIHQIGGALKARKELEEEKQALAAATKKPEFE